MRWSGVVRSTIAMTTTAMIRIISRRPPIIISFISFTMIPEIAAAPAVQRRRGDDAGKDVRRVISVEKSTQGVGENPDDEE